MKTAILFLAWGAFMAAALLTAPQSPPAAGHRSCQDARAAIVWYRARARELAARHDAPSPATRHAERSPGCAYVRWSSRRWRWRARVERRRFEVWLDRTYAKWACIHSFEAAWNDPNPPHWGGVQMDLSFQRTYGGEFLRRWGTADGWPVWSQLLAAERAFHGYAGYGARGFSPWPNTRRMCGL